MKAEAIFQVNGRLRRHFALLALLGQKPAENPGRQLGDRRVVRDRAELLIFGFGTIGLVLIAAVLAYGQPPQGGPGGPHGGNGGPPSGNAGPLPGGGGGPPAGQHGNHGGPWPVYQRDGSHWMHHGGGGRGWGQHGQQWMMPQVSSGWFQRPYPYHLDYYKMRWGGSYAPYFGNLYGVPFGTPQVVNGGWGPGAGDWGPTGGGPPGYEWMDGNGYPTNAVVKQAGPPDSESQPPPQQNDESLPAPKQ